jgi:hypothetical protein
MPTSKTSAAQRNQISGRVRRKIEYRLFRRDGEVEGEFIKSRVDRCSHYPQGLLGSCGVAEYRRWDAAENCGSIPDKGDLGTQTSKVRKSLPLLSILLWLYE